MRSPNQSVSAAAIIPRSPENREPAAWQRELAAAFTRPRELLDHLGLGETFDEEMLAAARDFSLRVPRSFADRMRYGDAKDPLLRQVLPLGEELRPVAGYTLDPVGDRAANKGPALLRKYQGRALVMTTGSCAVHCRYCFRRHFPYDKQSVRDSLLCYLLDKLLSDESVEEVILSGGDPLSLGDSRLATLVDGIRAIGQVKRLRVHTRLPVILPSRVTPRLIQLLVSERVPTVVVLHINHPREINAEVRQTLGAMRSAGISLFNQAVLLRGVNDDANTLCELSETCFDAGILPYYLHQLDPVSGAAHFAVTDQRARDLARSLRARLPGYLVPRLVREIAGAESKVPL
jgi:EF-P beta-lysylation protein EpmB